MKPALSSVSVVGALATYPEPVIQCGWSTFAVSLRDDRRRPSTAGIIRAPLSPRNPVDTIVRPLIHHNGGIAAAGRRLQIRRSFGEYFAAPRNPAVYLLVSSPSPRWSESVENANEGRAGRGYRRDCHRGGRNISNGVRLIATSTHSNWSPGTVTGTLDGPASQQGRSRTASNGRSGATPWLISN